MVKHGKPPYLECSSRGDKRFSAFYARVAGRSIEETYQAAKVFDDGSTGLSWKQAKGKQACNHMELQQIYSSLWDTYISEHPELLTVLQNATGLQDMFGQVGHVCQATELWRIRGS